MTLSKCIHEQCIVLPRIALMDNGMSAIMHLHYQIRQMSQKSQFHFNSLVYFRHLSVLCPFIIVFKKKSLISEIKQF